MRRVDAKLAASLIFYAGFHVAPVCAEAAQAPDQVYALSPKQLKSLTAQSDAGNIKATLQIAEFYLMAMNDSDTGFKWLERAGELGDAEARKDTLVNYSVSPNVKKRRYGQRLAQKWRMIWPPRD